MLSFVRKIVHYTSSSTGAKVTLALWLIAVVVLSVFAPGSNDYKENSTEGSIHKNKLSETASQVNHSAFPANEGLTALVVFHDEEGITNQDKQEIETFSKWVASDHKPDGISSALPFHQLPKEAQDNAISDDGTTLLFHIILEEERDSKDAQILLEEITKKWGQLSSGTIQFEVTGPAGIAADTLGLFQNADFVLMLATVILIFIVLILIYRSPLLAIIPLLIAGIVYGVVDRVLGLLGKYDVFSIEGQAVSIMLVLLFAVITDYSLFIFSRYRESLHQHESKYGAMGNAIYHVCEPIFFSGGTVILAMLSLFVTVFKPYHYFAPVFSVAVLFILLAGITLIPAIFAILGRKAFWPAIPRVGATEQTNKRFWGRIGGIVTKRPKTTMSIMILILFIGIANVFSMRLSFNLLKSFPEDVSSRAGFELLEDHYPAGELAPTTILLESDKEIDHTFLEAMQQLQQKIKNMENIDTVQSEPTNDMIDGKADLPRNFISDNNQVVKFNIVLASNPYDSQALSTIDNIRSHKHQLLKDSNFTGDVNLYVAGQTADQLDVKEMNNRDMIVLFSLVVILLTIVLGFQTKSVPMPIIMMGTIILSYIATLGFSWIIFHQLLHYDAISYRIPVYTFVFMVALGIDYNIMLVSRIKEFAKKHLWKDAVRLGVTSTGGVISSAGLILAATFSVLMTQPIQELFLFGFVMSLGILLDTFLIRGFFLPAILVLFHKK